jgi:[ribosomal protein S5]-alanine N-acetyltransferase
VIVQECPLCGQDLLMPVEGSAVGRKLPIPITTSRLVLRRLSGIDWKDLLEIVADEELYRYQEGHPLEENDLNRWLEADSQIKLTTPEQAFCLGIEERESHKLIGLLTLKYTDHHRLQTLVNILMNRQYQTQGFAEEALAGVLNFGFQGLRLHRICAYCDSRNTVTSQWFEKATLRREGEFLKDRFMNGEWVNTIWFALLNEEYQK